MFGVKVAQLSQNGSKGAKYFVPPEEPKEVANLWLKVKLPKTRNEPIGQNVKH